MSNYIQPGTYDYARHNDEVRGMWDAYHQGHPQRVPIQFSMNARMVLQNPELNVWRYSWQQYFESPDVRWDVELAFQKWARFNVIQDSPMRYPEKEWAGIGVHYQNCDEAAWFGCPLYYPIDDMPFIKPILQEHKEKLYDLVPPDPMSGGIMARAMEHYQYLELKRQTEDFDGLPVGKTWVFGSGTDGPFTVACNLRGASEVANDLYDDPAYVHDLLSFITGAIITRMQAILTFNGHIYPNAGWGFADDSVELISTEMYKEFVQPYHQKLLNAFSQGGPNSIHLCGRVQHHLKHLKDQLNIKTFDLGFPTDMGKARNDLGEDVTLIGNIAPHLLQQGTAEAIRHQTISLCRSGVMRGGKFILHDGNNCAPNTPVEHFQAMYDAGREYGVYTN